MVDGANLPFTAEVEAATQPIWARVKSHITPMEWRAQAPLIAAINELKRARNAVILAHNYMTPDIFHGVGDYVGDSLGLAREAASCEAQIIVQAGVHFMAETSKILSPDKTVLIPDLRAGCSLASSITGADVRLIKQRHPGLPVVTYVNTTAEVKAETDICCTSANAVQVVEDIARAWGVDRVILIPDEFLARNVARQTSIGIIAWQGRCEVHERFNAADIAELRIAYPGAEILAHPECPTEVLEASDFAGSTAAMNGFVSFVWVMPASPVSSRTTSPRRNALRSMPAQKLPPAPVMTAQRIRRSALTCLTAASTASDVSRSIALRACGRSMVMTATPS